MSYFTDRELLDHYEFYTLQVEQELINGEDFETLGNEIPFFIRLNHPHRDLMKYTFAFNLVEC